MSPETNLVLRGPVHPEHAEILTPEALAFVRDLVLRFGPRVEELLLRRQEAKQRRAQGESLRFPPETADVRAGDWRCAPLPDDLQDRRVEITGPVDRKMIINALNSGANVFMADIEDSNAPTWANVLDGQVNLRDAVNGTITFGHPTKGTYALVDDPAVLLVRPRGWHLPEKHVELDGKAIPAALFDFGLYFFHNALALIAKGSGPYFYLPKLEHYLEARLWNDVFVHAQRALGIPTGTIKATVLIETLPAAYQIDEILFELKAHSAGLNCGRWDYIFSTIKTLADDPSKVLPDRGQVGMTAPFMAAYTHRVIALCHKRGVHAMGGMAAQIPIKGDPEANEAALNKVRADKLREVTDGHDGTWVAHPALVPIAKAVFDAHMPMANQINLLREDDVTEADLVDLPGGTRTEEGLRLNIRVGVQYLAAWLCGNGCVPLYHLMEDAATAEISRAQVWQWLRHGAELDDGRVVTTDLFETLFAEELTKLKASLSPEAWDTGRYELAAELFSTLTTAAQLEDFLTLPAYEHLLDIQD
ncbi:MAG: malate synthase A [Deltaproteobacteria bacterium]|nr:MAG: malate synthase A [Deltaproteobacteria bacterium]